MTGQREQQQQPPLLVDTIEAARLCGCHYRHIQNLVARGQFIRPVRLGKRILFSRQAIELWVAQQAGLVPIPQETAISVFSRKLAATKSSEEPRHRGRPRKADQVRQGS